MLSLGGMVHQGLAGGRVTMSIFVGASTAGTMKIMWIFYMNIARGSMEVTASIACA
jgi:hypothetical protein